MPLYYGRSGLNKVVAHMTPVVSKVRYERDKVATRADENLQRARASTQWEKISGDKHETKITSTNGSVDAYVNLEAEDPEAIEYGHYPSGFFEPERYGRVTKAPQGLYILTGAAGFGGQTAISTGAKRGKRG
ncbi:hypothetical protein PBI_RUOTULA_18 [Mycobacterium phage Ruotula]|nr:hypothetical protein PBI_RUOTULA_18 [Mycobacterium phage Ruotula]AZF93920.1 hypothetical protein SEA_RHYNN_19 [Mycobacterium phage Rhynn]QGJ90458.1 hypothetical protein SEA_TRAFT412_21 [Mycobacterium phage Traft412]